MIRNIKFRRKVKIFYIIYHLIFYAHVILYVSGILSHVFKEERGMTVLENKLLRTILRSREGT